MPAAPAYGPDARPRAVVLTFDNLGEASELERGTWDASVPLGDHPSVTVALPRLLDALDAHGLTATFFVEAVNCELNPQALALIADRGHELGVHGWRHEPWGGLDAGQERVLLHRATDAFAGQGLRPAGFRPPGGELTAHTPELLGELGYRWCSPEGRTPECRQGLAFVPFAWELVDAYYLMDSFRELRARHGDPAPALDPAAAAERMLADLTRGRGVQTLILHPFLMLDEAWWQAVCRVLALIARLRDDGAAWAVPGGTFAAWLAG